MDNCSPPNISTPFATAALRKGGRKRVQFMYGGKLQTISAEMFGDGIDMWLRSRGESVRLLQKYVLCNR